MVSLLQSIDPDFRVLEARDGKIALETILSTRVDVVITDICMPHMTGLELLKELKRIGSRVKMVILSVYGEFEFAKQALDAGVFGYLLKPIDIDEVKDMMGRLKEAIASEREASHSTAAIEQNLSRMVPIYTHTAQPAFAVHQARLDESTLIQKYPINQPDTCCCSRSDSEQQDSTA